MTGPTITFALTGKKEGTIRRAGENNKSLTFVPRFCFKTFRFRLQAVTLPLVNQVLKRKPYIFSLFSLKSQDSLFDHTCTLYISGTREQLVCIQTLNHKHPRPVHIEIATVALWSPGLFERISFPRQVPANREKESITFISWFVCCQS